MGLKLFADHELGGAAADVHHQLLLVGLGRVGDAHVDQAGLLAAGDDLDGKAQRGLGLHQK